ncbi:hypothetical protein [Variovorax saccharolyticus]|uniref:hypothetical protein n=1 Tax=Variovorax saccharolyticus TaxID=3053516 RepID=UPI002575D6F7|nr:MULTISPECIES: hypothetical protein [unclassified Variovorax]MDM0022260.1 hypothetical protein [Variovorax sp. J22R187]MDM0028816.1 hypothetical protein [Variovorax sp. J31P216]
MKYVFQLALDLAGLLACLVAMASAGSLLHEALAGERQDFGAWGVLMLALLIVGQCRALWVLTVARQEYRHNEEGQGSGSGTPSNTSAASQIPEG